MIVAYATVNDLAIRLGNKAVIQLTNSDHRATAVDTAVAEMAIADGQAIVDSYIGQRKSLPLETVPHLVKTLTVDLSVYYLKTKVGNTAVKDSAVAKLYDDAIKHLERFAAAETSLGLHIPAVTPDASNENAATAQISCSPRQNTREKLGKLT